MICRKCGFEVPEGAAFCSNCGEKVFAYKEPEREFDGEPEPFREEPYSDPYKEPYSGGAYPPHYNPPVNDKAPGLKEYLKWMLLYPLLMFIPGVGTIAYFVVCIIRALDKTYEARANYFKAVLIVQIITIVIAVLFIIIVFAVFGSLVATGVSTIEDMYPGFYDEFLDGYNTLCVFFGK